MTMAPDDRPPPGADIPIRVDRGVLRFVIFTLGMVAILAALWVDTWLVIAFGMALALNPELIPKPPDFLTPRSQRWSR